MIEASFIAQILEAEFVIKINFIQGSCHIDKILFHFPKTCMSLKQLMKGIPERNLMIKPMKVKLPSSMGAAILDFWGQFKK